MRPDAIMIFAAGFGTRMGTLTKDRPKPLLSVGGETLLDRTLALSEAAGIGRKVVNAHYHADQIARHLAGRGDVHVAHETPEILDTGGGLKAALPVLGAGPVFTANSDAVFAGQNPFRALAAAWDPAAMDALLLLVPLGSAIGRQGGGDFVMDADGRLSRGGGLVYTGAQIADTGRVAEVPERVFSLNRVWDAMAAEGRLFGTVYPGRWCDVGHPEGIAQAEAVLADV
jgi:MurNAc alpha-1-phosphate uridylyltransferase